MRIRTSLPVVLLTGALLVACSPGQPDNAPSQEFPLGTITIAAQPAPGYIPLRLGLKLGKFQDAGLNIDFVPITGVGAALSAMENGSADIHTNSVSVLLQSNAEGADLRAFCGDLDLTQGSVYAAPGSTLPVADMNNWQEAVRSWKGKTIGVFGLGGSIKAEFDVLAQAAGLSPDDLTFSAVGVGEQATAALENGIVDLLFTYPFLSQNLHSRGFVEILKWEDDTPDPYGTSSVNFMAKQSWLETNTAAAETFCRILNEVEKEMFDHPDQLADIVGTEFGVTGEALDLSISQDGPLANHNTEIDCEEFERAIMRDIDANLTSADVPHSCDDLVWRGSDR